MGHSKKSYTYILFNKRNGTLYTGVTSALVKRVYEHKSKAVAGFTGKYAVDKLGYYEEHETILAAIAREKQIKAGSRADKIALIEGLNPEWRDLYDEIAAF
ncbi:MAG: GIY-YIG nuclease family protein [Clostridiales bacterium]|nr:GIY-YIG nuclease family protein [Clostridiales bacterium]